MLADKVAKKVKKIITASPANLMIQKETPSGSHITSKANNLTQFVDDYPDFEVLCDANQYILVCKTCKEYFSTPLAFNDVAPAGGTLGSLARGLFISSEKYEQILNGHNETWYHQKARLLQHLGSNVHQKSLTHSRKIAASLKAQQSVVKNQLRTALGIIKSKAAALQYEERIAELYAAGANIGDFGHSRKLFPDMAAVAVAFIQQKSTVFLTTPLPNTGFPPHFYVSSDKSTNHRVTNQVALVCPVVNGKRQGIIASVDQVYTTSDGTGGSSEELAQTLLNGVKKLGVAAEKDTGLFYMQGKVMDGQYLTDRFIGTINNAIVGSWVVPSSENSSDAVGFWWPCQWDPSHWIDKVFSKFKNSLFVERLLKRANMYHQLFGYGKLHGIAKAMSQEQSHSLRVTNAFAHQRFLSSSYLSLQNLYESLELYIEAFKDHDNREEISFKIYGCDFVTDLLGILDLLRPLVTLMKQVQASWCPGWKLHLYIPAVTREFEQFIGALASEPLVSKSCPLLTRHMPEITQLKFGKSELVEGWIVKSPVEPGKPVQWEAREIQDCFHDLTELASNVRVELQRRFSLSCPGLLQLLSKCLDFGKLFFQVCGRRTGQAYPVNKREFALFGLAEFEKCVSFVCQLPHVREQNLEIGPEFASSIYWHAKSTILEIVWGKLCSKYFAEFFDLVPEARHTKLQISEDAQVIQFAPVDSSNFTLRETFEVTFQDGETYVVSFNEKLLIHFLYTDSFFYSQLGREFCLVFDIMYAKTGSEAVAESFYRVMEKQEKDGGQSFEVL